MEAGEFYIGQMEMRRREHSKHLCSYRFLLIAYRVAALYGESYLRPFAWYLLLAPLFALGYWLLGAATYGDNVFAAITAGRLITEIPEEIKSWEKLLVYANMLTDILLITLTVVALRRRFHR